MSTGPEPSPARRRGASATWVSRHLAEAGHQRSLWDGLEWTPGFRATQVGRDAVVYCEGPRGPVLPEAEAARLAEYALALRNLGYAVETVPREEIGRPRPVRNKLIVTRAPRPRPRPGAVPAPPDPAPTSRPTASPTTEE